MGFQHVVQEHEGKLSTADNRLIRELLENPAESAFLSATELAARGGVHQAAATRLAKKLGYRGYVHLRADLQEELLDTIGPGERVRRRLAHTDDSGVLSAIVAHEVARLSSLPAQIPAEQIDTAASMVSVADRVFIFGHGHATALVDLMDRRLRRSGYRTVPLVGSSRDLAERSSTLAPGDAVLAFGFHRQPAGLRALLTHAADVGSASILISDPNGPLWRPQPTLLLIANRGPEAEFQSLTVPMAICNALILTLARVDPDSVQALDRLSELIDRFEAEGRSEVIR